MTSVPADRRGVALLDVDDVLRPPLEGEYLDRVVEVPAGTGQLRVELDYVKVTDRFQLYAALIDPDGVFRGHVQCPGGPGPRELRFTVGIGSASPGAIAGPIAAGTWTLRIDLDRFRQEGAYALRLFAVPEEADDTDGTARPRSTPRTDATAGVAEASAQPTPAPSGEPGWLRGELHCHSQHSDGRDPVAAIVADARSRGFDFLALSDHFTWSHWAPLAEAAEAAGGPIVLPSIEVTTHRGHGNAHGLRDWVDVYVDGPDRTAGELVREVHAQGGLFGVNHPFSGQQAWRRSDVPWAEVDLLEVVNQGQDANNDAAIGLWDRLLAEGHDIAPVAGTDCHELGDPAQRLGQVVTAVRVAERSAAGLLDGLRRAATVVTRGAELELRLRSAGREAGLGEHLELDGTPVELQLDFRIDVPCALFVIRDGLMWFQGDVEPGETRLVLVDDDPVPAAYRAELHRRSDDPRHWASAWRSHESFEALTSFVRTVHRTTTPMHEGES
ncbi:CehA/McbA family metallohydrolase [Agromyces mediolanus]|uniref:CehA/McbA family metallohydrolase n=1 Tax=Agromyces mediolanus TaxID=41986 RepID=UPI003833D64D